MRDKKQIEAMYYLSPLQEGLLFHRVAEGEADPYWYQYGYQLQGDLQEDLFVKAWQEAVRRHAILRTAFVWEGVERPLQVVRRDVEMPIHRHDFRGLSEADREKAVEALLAKDRQNGMDFMVPPLMRLHLIAVSERRWYLFNSHHHILLDGWSMSLLLQDVLSIYEALRQGRTPRQNESRPYRDYIAWRNRQDERAAETFWRAELAGFRVPTAPALPEPDDAASDERFLYAEQEVRVDPSRWQAMQAFAQQQRVTVNTLIQGAWALLLNRYSGEREVLFGATVSGRPVELTGSENMVGLFINTIPVRVAVSGDQKIAEWLSALQVHNSTIRQYEWTPLARIQRWSDIAAGRPLFETLVVFESYPEQESEGPATGVTISALKSGRNDGTESGHLLTTGRNNYPLSLMVEPGEELRLIASYARRRFTHAVVRRLLTDLTASLDRMLAAPTARLFELSAGTQAERRKPSTPRTASGPAASAVCIHEMVAEHARKEPDRAAVVYEGESLTYRDLDARAESLASVLRTMDVGPESLVGLCMDRSLDMIVGLLAVLKAGAGFVPIDPKLPQARVAFMLRDSGAEVVLTHSAWMELLHGIAVTCIPLDREWPAVQTASPQTQSSPASPQHVAYVIYTSGSTGEPKGVSVEHRQLVAYVRAVLDRLVLPPDASLATVSTVGADLGHTSIFGALCSGRTLHVLSADRGFDPDAMASYMHRHRVGVLKIAPSHLGGLLEAAEPAHVLPRHCLILGGERVRPELVNKVRALAPDCAVVNHYGPTETTVGVIANRLDGWSDDETVVPIGRPLAGACSYVLDHDMNVVPFGVPGELYVGGAGLSRGYLRRPDLTADRFIPDPFGEQPGGRLYRTGDRVREREDGTIEYIGRVDYQVKLRGFRIELGEIENRLRSEGGVSEAVVLVREGEGGSQQLVAYVTANAPIDVAELRNRLAKTLPEYMVPGAIVVMESWPLTRNGKVDRAALPDSQDAATGSVGYVAPRNEIESILAGIWADVLRRERIGIHDNFFSLGGDSIRSLQVIARANQKGVKLTPKQLFECQTVAEAAAVAAGPATAPNEGAAKPENVSSPAAETAPVKAADAGGPGMFPLVAVSREDLAPLRDDWEQIEDLYPLSPMQEGMLFHTLMNPGSGIYLMQQRYMWRGHLDRDLFVRAWHRVIQRYQILRTSFMWKDLPQPLQAVHTTVDLSSVIEELDWRTHPESEHGERLQELLQAELSRGLDLAKPPLMRIHLVRLADDYYAVVRSFHHILTDDWCFSLLMMDFRAYYQAFLQGRDVELPPVTPYREYIAWLKKQDLAAAETFWRTELKDCSGPTALGIERAGASGGEDSVDDVYMELSTRATEQLQALASRHQLTPNTIVQGAWALLLARYNGQRDVVFGVTVAGRPTDLDGVESIVGLFINSLPLKVRVSSEMSLVEWLKELLAQNYRIRQFEYPPLIEIQRWGGMAAGQSLFHSLLVFENAPKDPRLGEQWGTVDIAYDHDRVHTNYPMTVVGYPGRELGVRLSFQPRWFEREVVQRMLDHLKHLLECMVANPDARLVDLSLIADEERRRLTEEWSVTKEVELEDDRFSRLFEAQAVKTPDAIAAACQGVSLTYAELNRRANAVAHALLARGAGPDRLVGILNERGLDLLVMIVGIFKAGAAYLPLDPGHPERRLAQVLQDSRAAMIVTTERYVDRIGRATSLAGLSTPVSTLEQLEKERSSDSNPVVNAAPANLAYVIYTSGSTGVPKGAMVEQRAMVNHLLSKIPALRLTGRDVVAQTASQCFDISVWQFLTALLCGGRVEIVPSTVVQDPRALLREMRAKGVTVLEIVPSLMSGLLEEESMDLPLRWMLPTGEALSPELCRKWFARYPSVPLVNAYGPAECADDVALHTMVVPDESESGYIPIGRPIPNLRLYVLGPDLELLPIGVAGELCIGGMGVGRGYLNDPARTAAAFVPDPFASDAGRRLYRSGDLVRFRRDGTLEFLGRRDHQVKIRGYRIELGEIEARVAQHPLVREAVVAAREDRPGDKRLVAYVVSEGAARDAAVLRSFVAEALPDYMVPSVVMFLDALPLTPNGKIDRKALPAPEEGDQSPREGTPRTAVEEILAGIWAEILGAKHVGIHDNFFELGGHSLLATQVVSRIRSSFQIELPLRSLFEAPTVEALGAVIEQARAGRAGAPPALLAPAERGGPLALSFAQQRLWFLAQMEPDGWSYNLPFALRLSGMLDLAALSYSFEQVIARHETLRTTFREVDGKPAQIIGAAEGLTLPLDELSGLPEDRRDQAVREAAAREVRRPFRLEQDRPIRARLLHLAEQEHVLLVTLHHIAADAWSMTLLAHEVAVFYQAHVGQAAESTAPAELPPLPVQYADFARWQRQWLQGPVLDAHLAYWKQRLGANPPVLKLPVDRARPPVQTFRGARHVFTVSAEQAERLRALSRKQGVTLFMTLLAAFNTLLFRTTGQEDILIGTDVANRNRQETEGLVGFFVNLLPLRSDLGGNPTFLELLTQVRRTALEAYAHQDLPFEKIVETLKLKRDLGGNPLVQALLVLQNVRPPTMELPGLEVGALELESEVARFDLGLFMEDTEEGLTGLWKYSTDLFEASTIAGLSDRFVTLLASIVAQPEARLSALEVLSHTEKESAMIESKQREDGKFKRFKSIQPKAVNLAQRTLVERRYLTPDQTLPLVLQPAVEDVDLAAWAQDNRAKVEQELFTHGAILFRGFALKRIEGFEQVAQALCPALFSEYGDLPREKAGRHVYGSTPYPADKAILFHNESSHLHRWPLKQSFFCVQASREGGETPIVDCRKMYERLRPELRAKFQERSLMYVRNFTPGFDVSWQDFFHTEDKAAVEETCRQHGVEWDWTPDGGLRTRQVCPAILKHPKTGEWVFFNQIQLHHVSYLEPAVRNSLIEVLGIERVPRNVYFGDGTPIEDDIAAEIGELYERTSVRFPWREMDLLMLDNMLVAHARAPFVGPRKIVVAMGEMINRRDVQTVNA
ncbi:non-ribosomal peptide synthetase [Nitrospira japonica]|nr:non-ribosomal peptide synthetase [Nitrospira japonica]